MIIDLSKIEKDLLTGPKNGESFSNLLEDDGVKNLILIKGRKEQVLTSSFILGLIGYKVLLETEVKLVGFLSSGGYEPDKELKRAILRSVDKLLFDRTIGY